MQSNRAVATDILAPLPPVQRYADLSNVHHCGISICMCVGQDSVAIGLETNESAPSTLSHSPGDRQKASSQLSVQSGSTGQDETHNAQPQVSPYIALQHLHAPGRCFFIKQHDSRLQICCQIPLVMQGYHEWGQSQQASMCRLSSAAGA